MTGVSQLPDELAVPRRNGALVFEAPWEARAFGVAMALHERGAFAWSDFSRGLAAEIRRSEAAGEERPYYESWLTALRGLVVGGDLLAADDLRQRAEHIGAHDEHDHHPDHPHHE